MDKSRTEADRIAGWLSSACYDMAGGSEEDADQIYNDPELLAQMIGDRICGRKDYEEIVLALGEILYHDAGKEAVLKLMDYA